MNESIEKKRIHITELDEFLAGKVIEKEDSPLEFQVTKDGSQGYMSVVKIKADEEMEEDGIDFELSPSEYAGLTDTEISDFLLKPLYTSSAYELFDFLFGYFESFEFVVEFEGNTWKIRVMNPS